jgi:hypothetical protein
MKISFVADLRMRPPRYKRISAAGNCVTYVMLCRLSARGRRKPAGYEPALLLAHRPGRNTQQAVIEAAELMYLGRPEVVDATSPTTSAVFRMPTYSNR